MYWKIDTSCLYKREINKNFGIQLRYNFYLEEFDKNYIKTLIDEKKFNNDTQKLEETGNKVKVPLHNHLILLSFDVEFSLIESIGNQLLKIINEYNNLDYFFCGENVSIPNTIPFYGINNEENNLVADNKILEIKTKTEWLLQ